MGNAHIIQKLCDCLGITIRVKERIRNDEGFLLIIVGFQFIKSNRQTAFLEVNLLRCTEPKHIFSPFSNGLDINQMFYIYIL